MAETTVELEEQRVNERSEEGGMEWREERERQKKQKVVGFALYFPSGHMMGSCPDSSHVDQHQLSRSRRMRSY